MRWYAVKQTNKQTNKNIVLLGILSENNIRWFTSQQQAHFHSLPLRAFIRFRFVRAICQPRKNIPKAAISHYNTSGGSVDSHAARNTSGSHNANQFGNVTPGLLADSVAGT